VRESAYSFLSAVRGVAWAGCRDVFEGGVCLGMQEDCAGPHTMFTVGVVSKVGRVQLREGYRWVVGARSSGYIAAAQVRCEGSLVMFAAGEDGLEWSWTVRRACLVRPCC
jgi:hypothetical protein